jgi:membrane-associated phospholipid phosphatase
MRSHFTVLLAVLLAASPVYAESSLEEWVDWKPAEPERGGRSPFQVDLVTDLSLTLTGLTFVTTQMLSGNELGRRIPSTGLDMGSINSLDRRVIRNGSRGADMTSDLLLYSGILLPHLLGLVDTLASEPGDGLAGFAKDSLILLETLSVNFIACGLVKFGVRRPRPYAYRLDVPESERNATEASLSFYSGHTAIAFSMATAYSYLYTKRHPDSPWVIPVWIVSHAMASTNAVMRVEAGKHFWTDVMVGAAVGSAIGFLVPYLHTLRDDTGVALRFTPLFYEGGMGVSVTGLW